MEKRLEALLFASRWLLVPFYVGLLGAILGLFWVFAQTLVGLLVNLPALDQNGAILGALTLIDLALTANLVVIVVLASYESFVSKIEVEGDRPDWMGAVGFTGVKLKLFTSIVAISGIQLLKLFMEVGGPKAPAESDLMWLTIVHVVFVATTLISALADWVNAKAKGAKG